MFCSRKDVLKNEISNLQKELGIHLITTRKLTSINDCREALITIVKTFSTPNRVKLAELIEENKVLKFKIKQLKNLLKTAENDNKVLMKSNRIADEIITQYEKLFESIASELISK